MSFRKIMNIIYGKKKSNKPASTPTSRSELNGVYQSFINHKNQDDINNVVSAEKEKIEFKSELIDSIGAIRKKQEVEKLPSGLDELCFHYVFIEQLNTIISNEEKRVGKNAPVHSYGRPVDPFSLATYFENVMLASPGQETIRIAGIFKTKIAEWVAFRNEELYSEYIAAWTHNNSAIVKILSNQDLKNSLIKFLEKIVIPVIYEFSRRFSDCDVKSFSTGFIKELEALSYFIYWLRFENSKTLAGGLLPLQNLILELAQAMQIADKEMIYTINRLQNK